MPETLGSLVDRLTVVNLKLWHVQEDVYRFQKMTMEEYTAVAAAETKAAWDRLAQLNLDRNALMTEIDRAFAEAVRTGKAHVDTRVKIT